MSPAHTTERTFLCTENYCASLWYGWVGGGGGGVERKDKWGIKNQILNKYKTILCKTLGVMTVTENKSHLHPVSEGTDDKHDSRLVLTVGWL